MSNLLTNPANWQSYDPEIAEWVGPPAATWDAAQGAYLFAGNLSTRIRLAITPGPSDTVAGNFSVTSSGSGEATFLYAVNGSGDHVWEVEGGAVGEMIPFTEPAFAGMILDTSPEGQEPNDAAVFPSADAVSYNCECDDDYPSITLAELRKRLLRRLGFSAQANNPPPGMADLLDDFCRQAQEVLFRRYAVFRRERWFTWDLIEGVRFYDLDANSDACTKRLEPRMISWAGISQGDESWRPLVCGIDPVMYTSRGPGVPSHYEIRQCIELWPPPSDATWKLRIKGQFGLLPFDADADKTSLDPEAIFLLALANAKAHYGQPDAGNYATQLSAYMRDLVRGSHMTARYFPGGADPRNAVRPIPVGGWPEDQA